MSYACRFMTTALLLASVSAQSITAQTPSDIWRHFAQRVNVGTELNLRLNDGRRVRVTLVGVRDDAVLVQPKTRVPVPIQTVPYGAIVSMEPRKSGAGAGKAVAIGVATGVATFFGILAIMFAAVGD